MLINGDGRLGRVLAVPGVRRPSVAARWLAAAQEAADDRLARAPLRTRIPVNTTVPAVGPAQQAHAWWRRPAAAPPRSRWPSPGQTLADDMARVEAVRDALGPDRSVADRRQRGLVARRGGDGAAPSWIAFDLEYAEQPVAHPRGHGGAAAPGRRPARRRRVGPQRGGPDAGRRARGRGHRRAEGPAARGRPRLPEAGGARAGCPSSCPARSRPRSASRPVSRLRRRCRRCPMPVGSAPCHCWMGTSARPGLTPVGGVLPVVAGDPGAGPAQPLGSGRRPGPVVAGPGGARPGPARPVRRRCRDRRTPATRSPSCSSTSWCATA